MRTIWNNFSSINVSHSCPASKHNYTRNRDPAATDYNTKIQDQGSRTATADLVPVEDGPVTRTNFDCSIPESYPTTSGLITFGVVPEMLK
jgi:hypothetical protein